MNVRLRLDFVAPILGTDMIDQDPSSFPRAWSIPTPDHRSPLASTANFSPLKISTMRPPAVFLHLQAVLYRVRPMRRYGTYIQGGKATEYCRPPYVAHMMRKPRIAMHRVLGRVSRALRL